METAGLIVRRPEPRDGRGACLYLTDAGRSSKLAAASRAAEITEQLAKGFTEEELAIVARWLASVPDRFSEEQDND